MIRSFRSNALRRFWIRHDRKGIRPDWQKRTTIILSALDAARAPDQLSIAGVGFHALSGDRAGRYAVTVSHNWRITFGWAGLDAIELDLEDYHGR